MENDLLYRLALTRVRGIGHSLTRILIDRFGEARAVFRANPSTLGNIKGIGRSRAQAIRDFKGFDAAEKELAFLEKYKISALFFTDAAYPRRLRSYQQAPALLFYKGTADLNAPRVLSVVGTRSPTEYGRQITDRIIGDLAAADLLIVSGLAYGIDAAAHKSALRHRLPTIGVLGHGLDRIYPQQHAGLAREMLRQGGLLTEFSSGTQPDEHNFPIRNRIVACMSDALIVVETGARGGSMLTVDNALDGKKIVFALPGRADDKKSSGCNALIQQGKAILLTSAEQLLAGMRWADQPAQKPGATQTSFFPPTARRPFPFSRTAHYHSPASPRPKTAAKPSAPSTRSSSSSEPVIVAGRSSNLSQQEPDRSKRESDPREEPNRSKRESDLREEPDRSKRESDRSQGEPDRSKRESDPSREEPDRSQEESDRLQQEPDRSQEGPNLSKEERTLFDLLRRTSGLSLDQLLAREDLKGYNLSLVLLTLELHGLVRRMPGKGYVPN